MNTVDDVAAYARVSRRTIERALQNGELNAFRVGTLLRIPDDAVYQWLARQHTTQTTTPNDSA